MLIRFTPEADAELAEAREWYSHQRQDLDLEFMQCIDDILSRVVYNPHLFPIVYRNLRRAIVRRFPFAVFYEIAPNELRCLLFFIRDAIPMHGNRGCGSSTGNFRWRSQIVTLQATCTQGIPVLKSELSWN
jgi:hypothetical protein